MNQAIAMTPPTTSSGTTFVDWSAVFAGAVAAAALSTLLLAFFAALGLSATSPWGGVSARAMMIWGGIVLVVIQVASFLCGGYLAGRLRMKFAGATQNEVEFRDGAHGFLVWSIGVLVAGAVVASAAGSATRTAVQAVGGAASAVTQTAAAAVSKSDFSPDYAIDVLLRPSTADAARPPVAPNQSPDEARLQIGRVVAQAIVSGDLSAADKTHLGKIVAARTGLNQSEAEARVDAAVAQVRKAGSDAELKIKEMAEAARKTGILTGFLTAAALLVGLAAATAGAALGGRHRDEDTPLRVFKTQRFW